MRKPDNDHGHEAFNLDSVDAHCYCQANWRQISDNVSAHVHSQCMCQN